MKAVVLYDAGWAIWQILRIRMEPWQADIMNTLCRVRGSVRA